MVSGGFWSFLVLVSTSVFSKSNCFVIETIEKNYVNKEESLLKIKQHLQLKDIYISYPYSTVLSVRRKQLANKKK